MATEDELQIGGIIAFRAPAELIARAEQAAAAEGISKSDVARRALMRDLLAAAGLNREMQAA